MKPKIRLLIPLTFLIILLLSSFFTFFHLSKNPPSLFSDEVDVGYQAFIFNTCHTDYFGNKFPVHFHSYSDWHTPVPIYSIAFFQKYFNQTDLAILLPSAIFGILTAISFFFLILELFNSQILALFGFFIMGLSPWLIHYSRTTFESVTGMLFFLILGLIFLFKYLRRYQFKNIFLSLIFFCFSLYCYSTVRLLLPFLAILFTIIWPKTFSHIKPKQYILLSFALLIISLPLITDTVNGKTSYRFSYINIFADPTVFKTIDYYRQQDAILDHGQKIGLQTSLTSKIFHNRLDSWTQQFLKTYLASFSTDFLLLKGDSNLRQGFGDRGYLFYLDYFFIIIGIGSIFVKENHFQKRISLFFLGFLLLAPISSSLTIDSITPHATRLILMLPPLLYFSVLGLRQIFIILNNKLLKTSILILMVLINLIQFSFFWHDYNYEYPNLSARYWHTGMKEAVISGLQNKTKGSIYYLDNYEPFLPFFLFYSKYIPSNSCNPASNIKYFQNNFFNGRQIDNKYYFGKVEWTNISSSFPPGTYFFIAPKNEKINFENSLNVIKSKLPNVSVQISEIPETHFIEEETFYLIKLVNEKK